MKGMQQYNPDTDYALANAYRAIAKAHRACLPYLKRLAKAPEKLEKFVKNEGKIN